MCGLCICLLTFAYAGRASGDPSETRSNPISELVSFTPPKGWTKGFGGFGGEQTVFFHDGSCRIGVSLFGGKDSRYPTVKDFLLGPEARDQNGNPAAEGEKITVDGDLMQTYVRSYRVPLGIPGIKSADPLFEPFDIKRDTFVLVSVDERFLLLEYSFQYSPSILEDDTATKDAAGLVAWKEFLQSFQVKRAEPNRKPTKSPLGN